MDQTLREGVMLAPRERPNRELAQVMLVTENLLRPQLVSSRLNYRLALAELMGYLNGWNDLAWFTRFAKVMATFSDDGKTLQGSAYGHRFRYRFGFDQLERMLTQLEQDRDTRQAVLQIWDPRIDTTYTKDKACNTQVYLKVRHDKLNITVMQRSSDLIWGLPVDNFAFCGFAVVLSKLLTRVKPGRFTHFIDSLHVYMPEAGFYDEERIEHARNVPVHPSGNVWSYPMEFINNLKQLRTYVKQAREEVELELSRHGAERDWPLAVVPFLQGGKPPCWS